MSGDGEHGAYMDWSKFERYFQDLFGARMPKQGDTTWMQEMFASTMNQDLKEYTEFFSRKPEVFETHYQVIVRLAVDDIAMLDKLRIQLAVQQLLLDGWEREQVRVYLPAAVQPRSARAVYRDGVVQISARKRKEEPHYYEVPISY